MDAPSFGFYVKTFTFLGLYLLLLPVAYTCFIFISTTIVYMSPSHLYRRHFISSVYLIAIFACSN